MDPRYHALLIGNSTFPHDSHNLQPLEGPVNDIALLWGALTDPQFGLFAPGDVRLVPERTMSEILIELETFFGAAGKDDRLLLYYSGHGRLTLDNQLLLCARDTRTEVARATAVGASALNAMIEISAAAATVIVLDCCFSGAFKSGGMPDSLRGSGRFVLTSCRGSQLANDADGRNGTSLFTQHLVDGLLGAASDSDGDGYVDLGDVYDHVYRRLRDEGRQLPQRSFSGHGQIAIARRPPKPPQRPPPLAPPTPPVQAQAGTPTAPDERAVSAGEPAGAEPRDTAPATTRARARAAGQGRPPAPTPPPNPGTNRPRHGRRPPTWLVRAVAAIVAVVAIALSLDSGGPARGPSGLEAPAGIALDGTGTGLYVADESRATVFRLVLESGKLETVFASGVLARPRGSGAAVAARLENLRAIVVEPSGDLVFAADGRIYRWAGGELTSMERRMPEIDNLSVWGLAVDSGLRLLASVGPGPATIVYRIVLPDGSPERVAGTGAARFGGDGGPATAAQIAAGGIASGALGYLYIADAENHRVRLVGTDGNIVPFAGDGTAGYRGDHGPAVDASLNYPRGLAVGSDSTVYIADEFAHTVRSVSADGIIQTLAGTGEEGFSGDNGPATSAQLNRPTAVAVDSKGTVYVSDTGNHRIRRISQGVIETVA